MAILVQPLMTEAQQLALQVIVKTMPDTPARAKLMAAIHHPLTTQPEAAVLLSQYQGGDY